jgi:hypothetical protein
LAITIRPDQAERGSGVEMIPPSGAAPSSEHWPAPEVRTVLAGTGPLLSGVLPPPLQRNHRPPLGSAPAAPEPVLEVENLRAEAQSDPEEGLRRQQRDVVAGGAIDLDEVALPEILDPRRVERQHFPTRPCS